MNLRLGAGAVLLSLVCAQPVAARQSPPEQTAPAQDKTKTSDQQPPAQNPPDQSEGQDQNAVYNEQVVVTASKNEEALVNAPASVSIITNQTIVNSASTSYADLFRGVPGLNVTQTSARDINITARGASSTLSTSQLALVDGRSIYLDFFGFIAWDFLPVNPAEIKQIEVIRGTGICRVGRERVEWCRERDHEISTRAAGRQLHPRLWRLQSRQRHTEQVDGIVVLRQRIARPGRQRPVVVQGLRGNFTNYETHDGGAAPRVSAVNRRTGRRSNRRCRARRRAAGHLPIRRWSDRRRPR